MVELLISMGIMGILIVIMTELFGSILTMKLRSQAKSAVAQDSRYVISRLTYDIARSSDITTPNISSTSDTLTLSISGTTYTYSLQDSKLVLAVGGGVAEPQTGIDTKIDDLSFTQNMTMGGKKSVQITLHISPNKAEPGGITGQRLLTTTVATRQ